MTHADLADRLTTVLAGLAFPAVKWQIITHAEHYGADARTRRELWALPVLEYRTLSDVIGTVGARRGDPAVQDIRRDPRLPATGLRRGQSLYRRTARS